MNIQILKIQTSSAHFVRYGQDVTHQILFRCNLVEGMAKLITSQKVEEGDVISVETGHEELSGFSILLDASESLERISALSKEGDFEVVGRVSFVGGEIFYVDVDVDE